MRDRAEFKTELEQLSGPIATRWTSIGRGMAVVVVVASQILEVLLDIRELLLERQAE